MSELGEIFQARREEQKLRKIRNKESTLEILEKNKVNYTVLSETHIRVQDFDFWPSTGLFINCKNKKRGRGVFNLLKNINVETFYAAK